MDKKKKYRYCPAINQNVEIFTFKEIFSEHWNSFVEAMEAKGKFIRPVIHEEIDKIINCQNPKMGTALYQCEDCGRIKHVPFTCKSRFCNTCGAKYSSQRAINMSSVLLKGEHRHVVFTIPEELRSFFRLRQRLA
jgi:predicted nucleic acid-binding Zn ribbon protein